MRLFRSWSCRVSDEVARGLRCFQTQIEHGTWEFPDKCGIAPALVMARGEYWLIGELSEEKEGVLEGAVDCGAYWKPGKPEKL